MNQSRAYHNLGMLLILAIGCTLMTGCEDLLTKELDIEEDLGYTSNLGLSGTLLNDYSESSSLPISHLLLSENQSILDTNSIPNYYNTVGLDLYKDGSYFNTFTSIGQGFHRNQLLDSLPPSFNLEPATYRVEVDHPEFGAVSAEAQMPEPVFMSSIEVKESSFTPVDVPGFQKRYEVTVRFYDPPGANYYKLDVDTDNYSDPDTVFFGLDSVDFQLRFVGSYIESITLTNAIEAENKTFLFDDSSFDGSYASFSFSIISEGLFGAPDLERLKSITSVRWSCLSEGQYNFKTSFLNYQDNQIFGPFSEPISLYSNVENGLGYLGAINYYYAPFNE